MSPRLRAKLAALPTLLACALPGCTPDRTNLPDAGVIVEPSTHPIVQVTMNANDPGGSGANPRETFLNVSNVNPAKFGKLGTFTVDGDQYAQPLYMGGLTMADGKKHDVVFAATEHDSVYAFDADAPFRDEPLWRVSLGTSIPLPSPYLPIEWMYRETVPYCGGYGLRESGITGTPAIDPETSTLYAVALDLDATQVTHGADCLDLTTCKVVTCDAPRLVYRLHALDLATGAEKYGGPVDVTGKVSGSGSTGSGGVITFNAGLHLMRPSLLIANHSVYFAAGSYADNEHYHGWVFAYDETTLAQTGIWNDTRDGDHGGIWQSGRGLLSDGKGSVYVVTGNGTFDANNQGHDYGDAVVKLSADLSEVQDYFTQQLSDFQGMNYLQQWDGDLGAAGATLIPGTSLLLASGKMGIGFLLDTGNLGKWSPLADNAIQRVRITWRTPQPACGQMTQWAFIYGTPVVWQGNDGLHLYVWGNADTLRDYALDSNGRFTDSGRLCFCESWFFDDATIDVPDPNCASTHSIGGVTTAIASGGAALSVSSNGAEKGTGILWATRSTMNGAIHAAVPGALEAYDAIDVARPLWTSDTNAARDALGDWAKFTPPTIANGKVYVPTFSNQLVVYGLLP